MLTTMKRSCSIVIPTKNEQADLPRLLASIDRQWFPMTDVVVVDNASTDLTRDIAKAAGARVAEAGPNQSAQRNFGAALAAGDILIFLDADMELQDGLLSEVATLVDGGAECVIVPEDTAAQDWLGRARAFERDLMVGDDSIEAARVFSRRIFQECGGYDDAITGGEDWLLSQRARRLTAVCRTSKRIVHHEGPLAIGPLASKYVKYGRGYYALSRLDASMALEHANPLRSSVLSRWKALASKPRSSFYLLAYKLITYTAGLVGFVSAALEDALNRAPSTRKAPRK